MDLFSTAGTENTTGTEISVANCSKKTISELNPFKQRSLEENELFLSGTPENFADALPAYDEEEALERLDKIIMLRNIYG